MTRATHHALDISAEDSGQRLDRVLALRLPALSRSRIQALISAGDVTIDGAPATAAARKLKTGERVTLTVPPPPAAAPEGQDLDLAIVYEDDDLIVIDKPPGMVVHPAPGSQESTLVNALLHHCGGKLSTLGDDALRPGIVHRLDKDTSGLLVAAKSDCAHAGLAAQFAGHNLERVYYALVWGAPTPPAATIQTAIGRHPTQRKKMAVVRSGGKEAITHYKVLKRFGPAAATAVSLVECRLETGRTHQIRVHMTHIGHPLVGDPTYGRATRHARSLPPELKAKLSAFPRQALHAMALGFVHPVSAEILNFSADLPPDMAELLRELEHLQKAGK